MRLSELLEQPVVDQHGHAWGQVHDVHLVQDGPLLAGGDAAFRVHGIVAGPAAFGTRLGYSGRRGYEPAQETKGPLPIRLVVRWLDRKAVYIPWHAVTGVEPDRITVQSADGGFDQA